jgi:hypothetical protein
VYSALETCAMLMCKTAGSDKERSSVSSTRKIGLMVE